MIGTATSDGQIRTTLRRRGRFLRIGDEMQTQGFGADRRHQKISGDRGRCDSQENGTSGNQNVEG